MEKAEIRKSGLNIEHKSINSCFSVFVAMIVLEKTNPIRQPLEGNPKSECLNPR